MKTLRLLKKLKILYVNKQQDNYLFSLNNSRIHRNLGSWTCKVYYTYH